MKGAIAIFLPARQLLRLSQDGVKFKLGSIFIAIFKDEQTAEEGLVPLFADDCSLSFDFGRDLPFIIGDGANEESRWVAITSLRVSRSIIGSLLPMQSIATTLHQESECKDLKLFTPLQAIRLDEGQHQT